MDIKKKAEKRSTELWCELHYNRTDGVEHIRLCYEEASHQAVSRCFYTWTFWPQNIFMLRSEEAVGPRNLEVTWLWNVTMGAVIRPDGIYREVVVSVFHSACVKWSYPDFLPVGRESWHEKESSRNGWHVCRLSRSCHSSSRHMTLTPLRNALHLHKHALWTVGKIFERQQFPKVMFWKWLTSWEERGRGIWNLSHRNKS